MKIRVYNEKEEKEYEMDFDGKTVLDLLNKLGLNPERYVVVKNGEVVAEDAEINDGDYIKILDVVSGG